MTLAYLSNLNNSFIFALSRKIFCMAFHGAQKLFSAQVSKKLNVRAKSGLVLCVIACPAKEGIRQSVSVRARSSSFFVQHKMKFCLAPVPKRLEVELKGNSLLSLLIKYDCKKHSFIML